MLKRSIGGDVTKKRGCNVGRASLFILLGIFTLPYQSTLFGSKIHLVALFELVCFGECVDMR